MIAKSPDATVVRAAMPTTVGGSSPPVGTPVPPGLARDDPRWTRPLPWVDPILHTIGRQGFLAMIGLA